MTKLLLTVLLATVALGNGQLWASNWAGNTNGAGRSAATRTTGWAGNEDGWNDAPLDARALTHHSEDHGAHHGEAQARAAPLSQTLPTAAQVKPQLRAINDQQPQNIRTTEQYVQGRPAYQLVYVQEQPAHQADYAHEQPGHQFVYVHHQQPGVHTDASHPAQNRHHSIGSSGNLRTVSHAQPQFQGRYVQELPHHQAIGSHTARSAVHLAHDQEQPQVQYIQIAQPQGQYVQATQPQIQTFYVRSPAAHIEADHSVRPVAARAPAQERVSYQDKGY